MHSMEKISKRTLDLSAPPAGGDRHAGLVCHLPTGRTTQRGAGILPCPAGVDLRRVGAQLSQ